jgi:hypothetical protein
MALASTVGVGTFVVVSLVVGLRLVNLSRRAYSLPSLSIGLTFLLSAGLGFPLLSAAFMSGARLGSVLPFVQGTGLACVNLGSLALWIFTWRTFRPGVPWAGALVVGAAAVLVGSFAGQAAGPGLSVPIASGIWFWIGFVARALALVWAAAESLRYYGLMRRRLRLCLADPLVTNRFLLWGTSAGAAFALTAASAVTVALGPGADPATIAALRLTGAACGLGAAAAMWLAFFPPTAYRRRFGDANAAA